MPAQPRGVVRHRVVGIDQRRELLADIQARRAIGVLHRRRRAALAIAGDIVDEQAAHQQARVAWGVGRAPVDVAPDAFDPVRGQPNVAVLHATLAQPLQLGFVDDQRRHVFTLRGTAERADLQHVICTLEGGDIRQAFDITRRRRVDADNAQCRDLAPVLDLQRARHDTTTVETSDLRRRQVEAGHEKRPGGIGGRTAWHRQQRDERQRRERSDHHSGSLREP